MYALKKCKNNKYNIYNVINLKNKRSVIAINDNKSVLCDIKKNLQSGIPKVVIEKILPERNITKKNEANIKNNFSHLCKDIIFLEDGDIQFISDIEISNASGFEEVPTRELFDEGLVTDCLRTTKLNAQGIPNASGFEEVPTRDLFDEGLEADCLRTTKLNAQGILNASGFEEVPTSKLFDEGLEADCLRTTKLNAQGLLNASVFEEVSTRELFDEGLEAECLTTTKLNAQGISNAFGFEEVPTRELLDEGLETECLRTSELNEEDDSDSDKSYNPLIDSNSSILSGSTNTYDNNFNSNKRKDINKSINSTATSLDISNLNVQEGCNDENLIVHVSQPKGRQKKHFCYFCKSLQSKLARHLETVHKNEEDVKKFNSLPKGSKERRQIIDCLRKQGDFIHNKLKEYNTGELIVCRRPPSKKSKNATHFISCPKCKGSYTKNNIRHHFVKCYKKSVGRSVKVLGRKIEARIHHRASDMLRQIIFPVLREDEVTRIIRYDELLILRGNKLCKKFRNQRYHDMIRAELRLLGRFLISMKKHNVNVSDFISIYNPTIYDTCILAVNDIANFDVNSNTFGAPSVATRIGTLLKKLGNLACTEFIKKNNDERIDNANKFLKLLEEDYGESINKTAEETITQNKRQKVQELPSKEDIKKLYNYLQEKNEFYFNILNESFDKTAWMELLKCTMVLILIFNRRRTGETEKILIEDYKCFKSFDAIVKKELFNTLSTEGKKAAERFITFDIRGKLGRTVPVLLHTHVRDSIELLLKYRSEANVSSKNPYLFGIHGTDKHRHAYIRGSKLMREYSEQCGASKPLTLRGTKLRKHIATLCVTFNLSENDISSLASFMGHDKTIHKTHYRQRVPEHDIPKFVSLLNAAIYNQKENININEVIPTNEAVTQEIDIQNDNDNESNPAFKNAPDIPSTSAENKRKRSTSPFGSTKRKRWTTEEKRAVLENFKGDMEQSQLPSHKDILQVKTNSPFLQKRSVPQIKTYLHNVMSGKTKIRF